MIVSTKTMFGLAAVMTAQGAAGTAIAERFIEGDVPPSAAVMIVSLTVTLALLGTCLGFVKWVLRNQGINDPLAKLLRARAKDDELLQRLARDVHGLRDLVDAELGQMRGEINGLRDIVEAAKSDNGQGR